MSDLLDYLRIQKGRAIPPEPARRRSTLFGAHALPATASRTTQQVSALALPVLLLVVIWVFFSLNYPRFDDSRNIQVILNQTAVLAPVAIGMTLVLMRRGIDLSVGSVAGLSSMVAAQVMNQTDIEIVAIACALGVGLLVGYVQGSLIARLKIPSFIITLVGLYVCQTLMMWISDMQMIRPEHDVLGWAFDELISDVPVAFVLIAGASVLAHLAASTRRFQQRVQRLTVDGKVIGSYTLSGGLAALTGLLLLSQVRAAFPTMGTGYELPTLAAAVIGGASLISGRGHITAAVIGAITVQTVRSGLAHASVESYWVTGIYAGIVLVAFVVAALSSEDQNLISDRRLAGQSGSAYQLRRLITHLSQYNVLGGKESGPV